jgi:hypothetical protein
VTVAGDLAALEEKSGGTHEIWTVPRALGGGQAWHARRHDAPAEETLHASMPGELADLIKRDLADQAIDEALAVLRDEFAGTDWRFGTVWASLAGPGVRRITACRGAVLLAAPDLVEMRDKLSREDQDPEEAPGRRPSAEPDS